MTTISAAVFDVLAASIDQTGEGMTMGQVKDSLTDIDPVSVESAVHRLADMNKLKTSRTKQGTIYAIQTGASRPLDGRGRPKKGA